MATGVLIAESLRVGGELRVELTVTRVWRELATTATPDQPDRWTLMEFRVPDADAPAVAEALAGCLASPGGWYADLSTDTETFVAFADRVFRYPRGDRAGRLRAQEYATSVGVPAAQLDWAE